MKKALLFSLVCLCLWGTANAVPAKPGFTTVTQTDGTTLQVQALGDEFHHSLATADFLTIAQGSDGDYYYVSAKGLTDVRAHDAASRTADENAFLAANRDQFTMSALLQANQRNGMMRARQASAPRRATQVPNNGTPRVPIILVQYKDKKMSNTKAAFEAQYKTNAKSVFQYFKDQSNGKYTPQFDIYGIYTLDSNRATYGGNSGGNDKGVALMVGDAVTKAGNDIDWSLYDNDGDGEADVCIVVYAGVGEAQAYGVVPNAVWPCQWSLSAGAYYNDGPGALTRNNTTIDKFAVFNEVSGSNDNGSTLDGIGTFCHEFSHCLGLPDFYETTYNNGYYGMGYWSLMNSGCYNGGAVDGDTPIGYSAYEKNFMGWIDYITPQENTQYTLPVFNSKSIENDQAIKITALNEDEYWILENRKKQGWDYYIQDEGVLITHFTYIASRWDANTVNNQAIQLATIIPADNSASESNEEKDLYGETNHAFTSSSTPAMKANMKANGSLASSTGGAGTVNKPVTEITLNSDGTASLWYIKGTTPSLSAPVLADASGTTTTSFTASWTHTSDISCTYTLNVTQGNTTVLNKTGITNKTYTVTGLEGGKTYTFKVKAVPTNSSQATESAWSNVKTVTLPEEIRPVIEVTPTSLAFDNVLAGETATKTLHVSGSNLEGSVQLALNDGNSVYQLGTTTISKADATAGKDVTVTFTPAAKRAYNGTITLTSTNATTVTVNLSGNGIYADPVMQTADTTQVKHTSFRADWTDATFTQNVNSYTLWVEYVPPVPPVQLLGTLDGSVYTGSYTSITLTAPWGGTNVKGGNEAVYFSNSSWGSSNKGNITFTIPEGYDNATFTTRITTHTRSYGAGNLTVATSQTSASGHDFSAGETHDWLVTASSGEKITITSTDDSYSPDIALIEIYSGDATAANAPLRAAVETGDSTSRTITGITAKYYVVKDLVAGGTFTYKVKAIYSDNTESQWSNEQTVTLKETPDADIIMGDVNGDGAVDVQDVSAVIAYILDNPVETFIFEAADLNHNNFIDVQDVSSIIDIILGN